MNLTRYYSIVENTLIRPINDSVFELTHQDGIDVFDFDWHNLILLDACRPDVYKQVTPYSQRVSLKLSRGSDSNEFISNNFLNRNLHDTVYVSANPYTHLIGDSTFHSIVPLLAEWDPDLGTVHPHSVTSAAIEAAESYPQKRLIIHYMQPHVPYLGPTAESYRDKIGGWDKYVAFNSKSESKDGSPVWKLLLDGDITHEEVMKAYTETLNIVLTHVSELLPELTGKTVISADHGEMLGERLFPYSRRKYGHTPYKKEELRLVPWQVIRNEQKNIKSDPPVDSQRLQHEQLEKRLDALGYIG